MKSDFLCNLNKSFFERVVGMGRGMFLLGRAWADRFSKLLLIMIFCFFMMTGSLFALSESEFDSLRVYRTPSVTVTAERAVEGKTPVPFINFTQAEIQRAYILRDVPELLSELPSIISYSEGGNSIGYSYLMMRGFDQHRISVFVNGIPQNDPEEHNVFWIDMPDIASNADNIQIQRGAGIVNYGAASIGGSINLTTSNFVSQPGVRFYSGLGWQEYGAGGGTIQPTMNKLSLEVSSGIVGNFALYGRLSRINTSGYRDNMWAKLNSYFLSAVRFDEDFTTQINVFGGPISDGLGYTGLPKEYIKDLKLRRINPSYWEYSGPRELSLPYIPRREQEVEEFSQPHYEILNDWYISDNLTLRSTLFYYTGDGYFDYSGTGWSEGYLKEWVSSDYDTLSVNFINPLLRGSVSNKHGGWIPRLVWEHGDGELSVGAELRVHRSEHYGQVKYSENFPMAFDPDYKFYYNEGKRDVFSLFIGERYNLNERLTLSFDGQLVRQAYRLAEVKRGNEYLGFLSINGDTVGSSGEDLFSINYIFFNPRLGINYLLQESMNVYSSLAITSREPRMKNLYNADEGYLGSVPRFVSKSVDGGIGYDFAQPLVKPESMLDFEIGWNMKSEMFSLGLNVYWMEYFDELVSTGIVDIWGRPVDGNVPRTRHAGIELQGVGLLMKNSAGEIKLNANATYSHNRIVEFDFVTNAWDTISLAGNPVGGFPDLMGNVRLSYSKGDFYCSLWGKYVGGFRTDNYGDKIMDERIQKHFAKEWNIYVDNKLDAYFVLNADLSYTFSDILTLSSLKVQAKVNNVLNNLYAAYGIGKEFFPGAERNFVIGVELRM